MLNGIQNNMETHRKYADIEVNKCKVRFQLDNGADITTIGTKIWHKINCPKLRPYSKTCVTATKELIKNKGCFDAVLSWKGESTNVLILVIEQHELALLSSQAIDALKLVKYSDGVSQVATIQTQQGIKNKYPELFSESLGKCNKAKMSLQIINDSTPVHIPRRPVALAIEPAIEKEINRLLKANIIEAVEISEWAAPIVVARKPNNQIRMCADYSTGLNAALKPDEYPLPNIEEILAKLSGNKIFTQLDLSDAYFQIELDEESKKLTTINTHKGLFMFNRLPFGIKTAPAKFQRIIEQAMVDIPGTIVYLDDILIMAPTKVKHNERLHATLQRLQEWGFRLKFEKCKFNMASVTYLGAIIDENGIKADPAKIKAIQQLKRPENQCEIRALLGMVNYYGKFLNNLHNLKAPLEQLLLKDKQFEWSDTQETSFQEIRKVLSSPLILAHYDPKQTLIVSADACATGIGGVLLQRYKNGEEKAVFHMSRSLTETQRNYSQIEKEALALITAVERFHKFIWGRKFILQTDHRPLVALFKTNESKAFSTRTASRLKRWALRLLGYDFDIEYVRTNEFGQADGLSRLIKKKKNEAKDDEMEEVIASIQTIENEMVQIVQESVHALPIQARKSVKEATEADTLLKIVMNNIANEWNSYDNTNQKLRHYYNRKHLLSMVDGTIMFEDRLVVPEAIKLNVLNQLHITHPGIRRMKQLARRYFYWPSYSNEIENFVKSCNACTQKAAMPIKTMLEPWPNTGEVWSRVHTDFAEPAKGRNIIITVDSYSKFIDAKWIPKITAQETSTHFRKLFHQYGAPKTIVSDNGTQFTSIEFAEMCNKFNITHLKCPPRHPQSNGMAEKMVNTIKRALAKSSKSNPELALEEIVYTYNYTPSDATPEKKPPAEIFFSRQVRTPLDAYMPQQIKIANKTTQQARMQADFNRHHGAKQREFQPNEVVTIQLYNDKRITGKVVGVAGKVILAIECNGRVYIRHKNQVLKRRTIIETETECSDEFLPELQTTTKTTINTSNATRNDVTEPSRRSERIRQTSTRPQYNFNRKYQAASRSKRGML